MPGQGPGSTRPYYSSNFPIYISICQHLGEHISTLTFSSLKIRTPNSLFPFYSFCPTYLLHIAAKLRKVVSSCCLQCNSFFYPYPFHLSPSSFAEWSRHCCQWLSCCQTLHHPWPHSSTWDRGWLSLFLRHCHLLAPGIIASPLELLTPSLWIFLIAHVSSGSTLGTHFESFLS